MTMLAKLLTNQKRKFIETIKKPLIRRLTVSDFLQCWIAKFT